MNIRIACVLFLMATLGISATHAQTTGHSHEATPYAGLETRAIKALSESDMEELLRGGGWGLALPAELNGLPGPAHLLELSDEIGLSADQVAQIEAIHAEMKREAIDGGKRLIAAEQAIEDAFAGRDVDAQKLLVLVEEASAARAQLRFVHLSRHLLMPPLLTTEQIRQYGILRGYTSDPCANVPDGHDPEMWKRHNGCS